MRVLRTRHLDPQLGQGTLFEGAFGFARYQSMEHLLGLTAFSLFLNLALPWQIELLREDGSVIFEARATDLTFVEYENLQESVLDWGVPHGVTDVQYLEPGTKTWRRFPL